MMCVTQMQFEFCNGHVVKPFRNELKSDAKLRSPSAKSMRYDIDPDVRAAAWRLFSFIETYMFATGRLHGGKSAIQILAKEQFISMEWRF